MKITILLCTLMVVATCVADNKQDSSSVSADETRDIMDMDERDIDTSKRANDDIEEDDEHLERRGVRELFRPKDFNCGCSPYAYTQSVKKVLHPQLPGGSCPPLQGNLVITMVRCLYKPDWCVKVSKDGTTAQVVGNCKNGYKRIYIVVVCTVNGKKKLYRVPVRRYIRCSCVIK